MPHSLFVQQNAAAAALSQHQYLRLIGHVQLLGRFLGGLFAAHLEGELLGGNQIIHIGHQIFHARIGAARVMADLHTVFPALFGRGDGGVQHMAVQMQHLGALQGFPVQVAFFRRGHGALGPDAGAAGVGLIQQHHRVEADAAGNLAHIFGADAPVLQILQHEAAEGIVADGAHVRRAHAQLLGRHQRRGAGASALHLGFHVFQLGILGGIAVHHHQGVVYRGANANNFGISVTHCSPPLPAARSCSGKNVSRSGWAPS